MKNCKSLLINSGLSLVIILIMLLISEGILQLTQKPHQQQYSVAPTGNQYNFYKFDEHLGWANAPAMHGVFKREEFEFPIQINELGMRNTPVKVKQDDNRLRIAFLGDSFVWGIGVSDNQRFTDIVGNHPEVESLNFGVSGYGPVQYLLQIEEVIKFKPNIVFLSFCLSNDFMDNVHHRRYGYFKPYFILDDKNNLRLKGYPTKYTDENFGWKSTHENWVLKNSILLRLSRRLWQRVTDRFTDMGLTNFQSQDIYAYKKLGEEKQNIVDKAVQINHKILEQILIRLTEYKIPLVIISAPTKCEYFEHCISSEPERKNRSAVNILEKTAKELNIDFIDTVDILTGDDFWKNDGHWNTEGHKKMANAITQYLSESNYL